MSYVTATSARCYRRKIVESIIMTDETPLDKVESETATTFLPMNFSRVLGISDVRENQVIKDNML